MGTAVASPGLQIHRPAPSEATSRPPSGSHDGREGTIPSTKVANQWRFKKARIDEWLMEREREGDLDFD